MRIDPEYKIHNDIEGAEEGLTKTDEIKRQVAIIFIVIALAYIFVYVLFL